jgi:predicted P-loop ATPase
MSAAPILTSFGGDLNEGDYRRLAERAISRELADEAGIRRVDSLTGRDMFGRRQGNLAGLIIPNVFPGEGRIREYRLRLDTPELERRIDGTTRERSKYLQPTGRRTTLYFPPGMPLELLADARKALIVTEGELKAVSLRGIASHGTASPQFAVAAVLGVWNWRGVVGATTGPDGDRRDVKGVIPDIDRINLKGRRVIIAYDADAKTNTSVQAARHQFTAALVERGARVGMLEWPADEGKGIDDRIVKVGAQRVLDDIAKVQFGDWRLLLHRSPATGNPIPSFDNASIALERAPEWAGVLGFDEFTAEICALREPPSPVTATVGAAIGDNFVTEATRWLERQGIMVKPPAVHQIINAVARRNVYHPVRDYLLSLPPWDGTPRLDTWLIDYCGVASSDAEPNEYAMAVGPKFLVSAVARIFQPGAKVDHMLVLEGEQGARKSSVARILAGDERFTDAVKEFGGKDCSMQLQGKWIVEVGELGAMKRGEVEHVKAFLSQQVERYRPPYGRFVINQPRQCIFIGTTNSDTYLQDESGNRRFWPIRCGAIDLEGLVRDRDQIWAEEALLRYRQGEHWWLEDEAIIEAATEQQRARYQEDPWQSRVSTLAEEEAERSTSTHPDGRGSVSVWEILVRLGVETARQDLAAAGRVSRCLKAGGWERFQERRGKEREWRYRARMAK